MKQTMIKRMMIRNFKGCKEATYDFSKNTFVYGPNASGKTTIADAFWWLLFDKDSLGNSKFNIRPLDCDGNRIDNVEIEVSAVLESDGREVELHKTQKQKWVKRRGSVSKELQGNENLYEIDGYPKSEKDYKERVSEIVTEELFKMLTNPAYFVSLKWKDQRDVLMRFASEISDFELAIGNSEFSDLVDEIRKAPSLDDIQKKYAKALSEWKKKLAELPVRIDEAERQKDDIDIAELELGKKSILEQIAEVDAKLSDASKQYEEYQKIADGIMETKFAISDLERSANQKNENKKRELERTVHDIEMELLSVCVMMNNSKLKIRDAENLITSLKIELEQVRKRYSDASQMKFDEGNLICPMCGQEYPKDKSEEIKRDFETKKTNEIQHITRLGNNLNERLKLETDSLEKNKKSLDESAAKEQYLKEKLEVLKQELSGIPSNVDVSSTEEYQSLQKKLLEKEEYLTKTNNVYSLRMSYKEEKEKLDEKLRGVERELSKADINVKLDERIEELQLEQCEVAQKVADQEKMIYQLENFIRYKMDATSEKINSMFDGVCWKLFENQINGGLKECCECTVNGVPYSSLNNGHKIIAGLKIIKALQELYGVSAPIFIDNAEAISDGNMPQMDCQMILLSVSNDISMRIEVAQSEKQSN